MNVYFLVNCSFKPLSSVDLIKQNIMESVY